MVPKLFFSVRGLNYPAFIRDDATRDMWVYVMPQVGRRRGIRAIQENLRTEGIPSMVEAVSSDGGGNFEEPFQEFHRSRGIRPNFPRSADQIPNIAGCRARDGISRVGRNGS